MRIDPQKLLAYNLTFDQVQEAVRRNNLDVGGGNVQRAGSMYLVRGLGRRTCEMELELLDLIEQAEGRR